MDSLIVDREVFIETTIHDEGFYAMVRAASELGIEVRLTRQWREFSGSYSDGTIIFFPWHVINLISPAQ